MLVFVSCESGNNFELVLVKTAPRSALQDKGVIFHNNKNTPGQNTPGGGVGDRLPRKWKRPRIKTTGLVRPSPDCFSRFFLSMLPWTHARDPAPLVFFARAADVENGYRLRIWRST